VANPNLTAAEREFLSAFDSGVKACTIGMSAFTADGRKLVSGGTYEAGALKSMLRKALAEFKPETVSATVPPRDDAALASLKRLPEGGLILYVTWKLVGDIQPQGSGTTGDGRWDKVFQNSLGSDRLWVRKDEAKALAAGTFPESLKSRILRCHVRYLMSRDAKLPELSLDASRIAGSIALAEGRRAECLGFVESRDGRVTRFELLVKGPGRRLEDHGFSACLSVVPQDTEAPMALYFELADPQEGLAAILPHRAANDDYLK
jgi:hypothetical protein